MGLVNYIKENYHGLTFIGSLAMEPLLDVPSIIRIGFAGLYFTYKVTYLTGTKTPIRIDISKLETFPDATEILADETSRLRELLN